MVQFGPSDYSMSIGRPDQRNSAPVVEAREFTIKTALKMGVHPRAELAEASEADYYVKLGVKHFCLAADTAILSTLLRPARHGDAGNYSRSVHRTLVDDEDQRARRVGRLHPLRPARIRSWNHPASDRPSPGAPQSRTASRITPSNPARERSLASAS